MRKKIDKSSQKYQTAVNVFGSSIRVLVVILAIVILVFIGKWGYNFTYRVFDDEPLSDPPGIDITVTIPEGSTPYEIGKILSKTGLIESALVFTAQERLSAYHEKEVPGTYTLNTCQTANEMLAAISPEEEDDETP